MLKFILLYLISSTVMAHDFLNAKNNFLWKLDTAQVTTTPTAIFHDKNKSITENYILDSLFKENKIYPNLFHVAGYKDESKTYAIALNFNPKAPSFCQLTINSNTNYKELTQVNINNNYCKNLLQIKPGVYDLYAKDSSLRDSLKEQIGKAYLVLLQQYRLDSN